MKKRVTTVEQYNTLDGATTGWAPRNHRQRHQHLHCMGTVEIAMRECQQKLLLGTVNALYRSMAAQNSYWHKAQRRSLDAAHKHGQVATSASHKVLSHTRKHAHTQTPTTTETHHIQPHSASSTTCSSVSVRIKNISRGKQHQCRLRWAVAAQLQVMWAQQ